MQQVKKRHHDPQVNASNQTELHLVIAYKFFSILAGRLNAFLYAVASFTQSFPADGCATQKNNLNITTKRKDSDVRVTRSPRLRIKLYRSISDMVGIYRSCLREIQANAHADVVKWYTHQLGSARAKVLFGVSLGSSPKKQLACLVGSIPTIRTFLKRPRHTVGRLEANQFKTIMLLVNMSWTPIGFSEETCRVAASTNTVQNNG